MLLLKGMELLPQYRIVVTGHPDCGKSTLIKSLVEALTGKVLSPDTLMREVHYSDDTDPDGNPDTRTMKCAKIILPYRGYEYCLYDAPGHLEYMEQIRQGLNDADLVVQLHNMANPENSASYFDSLPPVTGKPVITLFSHAPNPDRGYPYYNAIDTKSFRLFAERLMGVFSETLDRWGIKPHNIEEEAVRLIQETLTDSNNVMFFSGGKDSAAGLKLIELAGKKGGVDVWMPNSGYDFPELLDTVEEYKAVFDTTISKFGNTLGRTYENDGEYAMMEAKALSNDYFIEANLPHSKTVCIQYRASDEGVRSKDYHISDRGTHRRFSPVFYFSESNIWRFLDKHGVPVCPLYFEGFRSLGDMPVTEPCMPVLKDKRAIIEWIEANPATTERDGRKRQDNSTPFGMEKLRNIGFF